jgi:hypothetical protein
MFEPQTPRGSLCLAFALAGCGLDPTWVLATKLDDASTSTDSSLGVDVSTPTEAAAPLDATAPSDANQSDAAESWDAPLDTPAGDAGDAGDMGEGGDAGRVGGPTVRCPGSADCTVPSEVCCSSDGGKACTAVGNCSGLSIPCDDAIDCEAAGLTGTVCCETTGARGVTTAVACHPPSACVAQNTRRLCDLDAGAAGQCPAGRKCSPSTGTLVGFDACR